MKNFKIHITAIVSILSVFSHLTGGVEAAIIITEVQGQSVLIGADSFELKKNRNGGTAHYFGNMLGQVNTFTANRVKLSSGNQYFQPGTPILSIGSIIGGSYGSTLAYVYSGSPYGGATDGLNFSAYDIDQNGLADTLFMLDFGSDILDASDDIIVAYAMETSSSDIDLYSARAALIPEPSSVAMIGLISGCGVFIRRRFMI